MRYFHFEPIHPADVIRDTVLDFTTAMQAYGVWLDSFYRRSILFYKSQYSNHCDQVAGRPHESSILKDHRDEWQTIVTRLETAMKKNNRASPSNRGDRWALRQYLPTIDALWFNQLISSPAELVIHYRAMPYEEYLQTRHWKRVRAAMLLLYGARCQQVDCPSNGESFWFGWEVELHIHHLSYEHLGNERYTDLQLLCNRCHITVHAREMT